MKKFQKCIGLVTVVFVLSFSLQGFAAEKGGLYSNPSQSKDLTLGKEGKEEGGSSKTRYITPTYENINKLLWLLGVYSTDNMEDVENYIKVSECNLYEKYYNNDFEWKEVLKATAGYLDKYSSRFSNYFEIVQPLALGRYDFGMQAFHLLYPQDYETISVLQIFDQSDVDKKKNKTCSNVRITDAKYAGSAAVKLKSPINLNYLKVDQKLAEQYLKYTEERNGNLDQKIVYIRYKIRVDRFLSVYKYESAGMTQLFSGRVLQMDIFADPEMFLPLYSKVYE